MKPSALMVSSNLWNLTLESAVEMADKPIAALVAAPVVSSEASSPEAVMAREAKKLQVQASTDGSFDTVLERFCGGPTLQLTSLAVVLSLFLTSHIIQRRYK